MDERPVLDQVNIVVADMAASVDFYRLLGADIEEPGPPWDGNAVGSMSAIDPGRRSDVAAPD